MEILIGVVILILVISGVWTLMITRNPDTDYRSSTKRNTTNLTLIYVVVIGLSLIALAIYVWLL